MGKIPLPNMVTLAIKTRGTQDWFISIFFMYKTWTRAKETNQWQLKYITNTPFQ